MILEAKIRSLRTTPISGKRSRREKAILGALGEFRGILGAALGIHGIRNSILGMASHDLSNMKPQFSEQLPERFPELMGTHMKDFHLPLHSRSVILRIGPARKNINFFCRPLSPGLPQGQTGFVLGTNSASIV